MEARKWTRCVWTLWPCCLTVWLMMGLPAAAEETERVLVDVQVNKTAPGGDPLDRALLAAQRQALQTWIDRHPLLDRVQPSEDLLNAHIFSNPDRYVSAVKDREETHEGTRLKLKATVIVRVKALRDKLEEISLLKGSVEHPRLAVLPDPTRFARSEADADEGARVSMQIIKNFSREHFDLVDPARSREIGRLAERIIQFRDYAEGRETPGVAVAQDLMLTYNFDVAVYYSVEENLGRPMKQTRESSGLSGLYEQATGIRVRVITNDRAGILAADERNERALGTTPHQARLAAAEKLGEELSEYLTNEILKWWRDPIASIELSVHAHGVEMHHIRKIIDQISGLPRVVGVTQRRTVAGERAREGHADLLVKFRGQVVDFVAQLDDAFMDHRDEYYVSLNSMGRLVSVALLDPEQMQREQARVGSKSDLASAKERVIQEALATVVIVETPTGMGTGFFVRRDGYALTNAHVVGSHERVLLRTQGGSAYDATVVTTNSSLDLALLKAAVSGEVKAARLGDSNNLRQGQPIISIGHPFGESLAFTTTDGIVTAVQRGPQGLVQTNALLYPGCSGGPTFDLDGNVVAVHKSVKTGMVRAAQPSEELKVFASGLTLVIPINQAKPLLPLN